MMQFRSAKLSLVVIIVLMFEGACSSLYSTTNIVRLPVTEIEQPLRDREQIIGLTTRAGADIVFDLPDGGIIRDGALEGKVKGAPYTIAIAEVQRVWLERRRISNLKVLGMT